MSTESETGNELVTWKVRDVLNHIPRLGIPHFQRGLVWGSGSVAALLESLFYETPCGSFVVWSPTDCAAYGVPLDEERSTGIDHLIIDGQQRIRSLYSAFEGLQLLEDDIEDDGNQDDFSARRQKVWCINLVKVKDYAELLKPQGREFSLFVYTSDPATRKDDKRPSPLLHNVVPLSRVLNTADWPNPELRVYDELIQTRDGNRTAGTAKTLTELYKQLRCNVLRMARQPFPVSIQHRDDPAEMANLYNRINAGGKRVEIEERAFAKLVGLKPETYNELTRLFAQVHGDLPETVDPETGKRRKPRDALLLRQEERAFGFKLFIRVFLQVCQYHLGYRPGKNDFSFDLIRKESFTKEYSRLASEEAAELWSETGRVLGHVRDVLQKELYCDDLRALPDATALTPIFQLLITYPELRGERYRNLLAGSCLRLALADLGSKEISNLVSEAADTGRDAFAVVPSIHQTAENEVSKKIRDRLRKANSIQSRYLLLLYWLERRLGARDFLYKNIKPERRPKQPELKLERRVRPEKQHMVPFSKAGDVYQEEVRRTESHAFNNIGNLTFISHLENHYETGLGDEFVDLQAEPVDNRLAHLLEEPEHTPDVLAAYDAVRTALGGEGTRQSGVLPVAFERMTALRRELIQEGFSRWLRELDQQASSQLKIESLDQMKSLSKREDRIEPVHRKFVKDKETEIDFVIRQFGLGNEAEDHLLKLAGRARSKKRPTEVDPRLKLCITKRQRVWFNIGPGEVYLRFKRHVSPETQGFICQLLKVPQTAGDKIALMPVPDFTDLLARLPEVNERMERDMPSAKKKGKK